MSVAWPGSRRHWLLVIALVLLYACAWQGTRPLYSPDEGRYTNVALEMLDSGDWLHPQLHREVPHWSKPPLTYWALAASFGVFGRHEFAARLPGALAFAGTILLLLRLGRRFTPAQPWLPALVYATFLFPPLVANLVTTDTLLTLWETLQVAAFVELWWAATPEAAQRARRLLGLAAGLAFMTKGPPGLLALAACLAFAYWSERGHGLARVFGWDLLAVFLAVGGSWYAAVVLQDPRVLHYFLVEEVVNRVASGKMHRNAEWYGAFKVYGPTLLLGTLLWLPWLAAGAWQHRRDALAQLRADDQLRLLACWLLLPLGVFMLSRSRLPLYVLPLFAPLALLVARRLLPFAPAARWPYVLLAAWCLALVGMRALPAWLDVPDDDGRLAHDLRAELAFTPAEVIFVETAPRFGLRFYLGSPIERVGLPGRAPKPQSQDLAAELAESEGCRVMLVEPDDRADLEHALTAAGIAWLRLPDVRHYAVLAPATRDCEVRAAPP